MASNFYNQGLLSLLNRNIDFVNDPIKAILVSPAAVFNKAHATLDQVTPNEVTNSVGTGYERKALANQTITLVGDSIQFDADDLFYTTIRTNELLSAIILYKEEASDAASQLIAFLDYNDLPTNGSDVNIQINSNGIFRINNIIT